MLKKKKMTAFFKIDAVLNLHQSITVSASCLDDVLTGPHLVELFFYNKGGDQSRVLVEDAFNNKRKRGWLQPLDCLCVSSLFSCGPQRAASQAQACTTLNISTISATASIESQ